MKLYRTRNGIVAELDGRFFVADTMDWDDLMRGRGLAQRVRAWGEGAPVERPNPEALLAPIGGQEVWAAGVTYYRSRSARMEEAGEAGGGSFYDRVYQAVRPELFFKTNGPRVIGPGGKVRIRGDARWSVPEPELVLVIDAGGDIIGYTIGNDMSSRDIEGENPLYLPQAKTYDGSCALGPCVLLHETPISRETGIRIEILRGDQRVFFGITTLAELKREPKELVEFLYREMSFPHGAYLMTGTGIVPGNEFTLEPGDRIRIEIDGVGALENAVA